MPALEQGPKGTTLLRGSYFGGAYSAPARCSFPCIRSGGTIGFVLVEAAI